MPGAPRAPLFPLLCRHIRRLPSNSSCLEHACTNHPSVMENLSYNHLISLLINADSAVSIFHHVNVCHTVAAFGPSNTVIKLLSQCCFYCLNVYIVHMPSGSLPLLLLLLLLLLMKSTKVLNPHRNSNI